jgi:hypothetical protein
MIGEEVGRQKSEVRRRGLAILFVSLALGAGCEREGGTPTAGAGQSNGVRMDENEYAKLRVQAIESYAGSPVTPVRSPEEFVGAWEVRHGGPAGSDEVQSHYDFSPDGSVRVGGETWAWRLNGDGTLSFIVTTPPDPTAPGLEEGAVTVDRFYPFKAKDGRLVLSNEDTSVVELLSRPAARPAT